MALAGWAGKAGLVPRLEIFPRQSPGCRAPSGSVSATGRRPVRSADQSGAITNPQRTVGRVFGMERRRDELPRTRSRWLSLDQLSGLEKEVQKAIASSEEGREAEVLKAAKAMAAAEGYTLADLLDTSRKGRTRAPAPSPRYRHLDDRSRTGSGRGRTPRRIRDAEAAGQDREAFTMGSGGKGWDPTRCVLAAPGGGLPEGRCHLPRPRPSLLKQFVSIGAGRRSCRGRGRGRVPSAEGPSVGQQVPSTVRSEPTSDLPQRRHSAVWMSI